MEWIKERATTISEAVGVRRFAIDGIVAVTLAILQYAASKLDAWPLSDTPNFVFWLIIVFGLLVWWLLNYATLLRKTALSALKVHDPVVCKDDHGDTLQLTIENLGGVILSECLVTLVEIHPPIQDVNWRADTLPLGLVTAGQRRDGRQGSFKLRPGQPKRIPLVESLMDRSPDRRLITELKSPIDLIIDGSEQDGRADFVLEAYAERGKRQRIKFTANFKWDDKYNRDNIEIYNISREAY